jgi:hypothetical protein
MEGVISGCDEELKTTESLQRLSLEQVSERR